MNINSNNTNSANSNTEDLSSNIEFNFETKTVKLNSGYEMPILGLGTWIQDDEETANSVYYALEDGYRLIDTAQYYGNEKGVGDGLKRAINDGIVTREEVFITTKIMPSSYNNAYNSIDESLRKLNIDYIDLLLIHQPGSNDEAVYKAMEQGVKDGKVKSIGISNYYTKEDVEEVLSYATITPLELESDKIIDIIDLRYSKDRIKEVIDNKKIFAGYHMNKDN